MAIQGIDVSEHQNTVAWPTVKHKERIEFVWVKVNEGDRMDSRAASHARGARGVGLLVGGYNFVRPRIGRTGAQEFDIFWERCREIGLHKDGSLRPVIDIEATKLNPAETREYVRSWIRRCFRVTGKHPIIYTGKWFYEGVMREYKHKHGCKLWLAAYVPASKVERSIPKAWNGHKSFWQYTDRGQIAGVSGNVDRNVYGSTMRNLTRAHTL